MAYTFRNYFKEYSHKRYEPMGVEEERSVFIRLKNGEERLRTYIMERNMRFIIKICNKYFYGNEQNITMEELISEAIIGMNRAIDKYDVDSGVKFVTYAVWWIKAYLNNLIKNINGSKNKLQFTYLDVTNVDDYDNFDSGGYNINTNPYEEEDYSNTVEHKYEQDNAKDYLFSKLTDKERYILDSLCGIDREPVNVNTIANELNATPNYIRKVKEQAITKLRYIVVEEGTLDDLIKYM